MSRVELHVGEFRLWKVEFSIISSGHSARDWNLPRTVALKQMSEAGLRCRQGARNLESPSDAQLQQESPLESLQITEN